MLAQPVASLSASRALMQHRAHVDAFHGNMVWTEETHMVDEMSAPAALVRPYGLCGQSSGHGFDCESVCERGEWCICTRRTHQPHDYETPATVTAGFAELGCTLLAQTSRVYVLTGPGAK